jgi:hypothetical protein
LGEAFPYLNLAGILSLWGGFEHRLKHYLKASYAMRSIPKKKPLESCRDDKKRALSCVALKKKMDLREERLLLGLFLPRPH